MSKVTIADLNYQLYLWFAILLAGFLYFLVFKVCCGVHDFKSEILCCQWIQNVRDSSKPPVRMRTETYVD